MRKKICFVSVLQGSAEFIHDAIYGLANYYDIYLVANITDPDKLKDLPIKEYHHIDICRNINISQDLRALRQLASYFKEKKFDAVHSIMPKSGLLTSIAAYFSGVPFRLHTYTGQVWATRKGLMRLLLKNMDRIIGKLDTNVLADSLSQRKFLVDQKVIKEKKSSVLGYGSICGVDIDLFIPNKEIRRAKRRELGLNDETVAFIFMGRLNRDKGVYELLTAFNEFVRNRNNVKLLLFGRDEENVAEKFVNYKNLNEKNFFYYGVTKEPYNMLQAADVFVLPTYREGFGSSVIEAQCMGLPVITSDAYGVLDASVEGVTGLRCKVGDSATLKDAIELMYEEPELRNNMGSAGRERVLNCFTSQFLVNKWIEFYNNLFG